MGKPLTLVQTVATAGVFSAISFWYGFHVRKRIGPQRARQLDRRTTPRRRFLLLRSSSEFLILLGTSTVTRISSHIALLLDRESPLAMVPPPQPASFSSMFGTGTLPLALYDI
ncbi:unnamed protein product [Linum trigynum]|uniref:Uncharacterized protein n=1 Tax=Linum trigynum TaxID=586398 RepID=A0AAV2DR95_9ROSI